MGTVPGTVTLDGKPLSNIGLLFNPVKSETAQVSAEKQDVAKKQTNFTGSYGQTDSNGKFTLKLADNSREGALVGTHSVTLIEKRPNESPDDDQPKVAPFPDKKAKPAPIEAPKVPKKWRDGSEKFTVKAGKNEANFDLSK